MSTEYVAEPLDTTPMEGGYGEDWVGVPMSIEHAKDIAEQWRRQGIAISFPLAGSLWWGRVDYPARLVLAQLTQGINIDFWSRASEPLDLSSSSPYPRLPHPFWSWRIVVEPANLVGMIYFVQNPSAPIGQGGSVMAEGLLTKDGVYTGLPVPFSAPFPNWNFTGNLQLSVTTDDGTTLLWKNPIWN